MEQVELVVELVCSLVVELVRSLVVLQVWCSSSSWSAWPSVFLYLEKKISELAE